MPRTKSQPERPQAEKMSKATGGTSAKAGGAGEAFMTTKVTGGTSAKAGGAGETLKTTKVTGGTLAKASGARKSQSSSVFTLPTVNDIEDDERPLSEEKLTKAISH